MADPEALHPSTRAAAWAIAWLEAHEEEPLESLSIAEITADAGRAGLAVGEALRQVAIACELFLHTPTPLDARRWPTLRRLYEAASACAPDDPHIHASAALSALELAEAAPVETRRALVEEAWVWAHEAVALAPQDAHVWRVMGQVSYADLEGELPAALAHFEAALALDPEEPVARLYRAHCLHDLERWREAAEAYASVPYERLGGHAAWRQALAVEQRAWCLLRAGEVERARAAFDDALCAMEGILRDEEHPLLEPCFAACPSDLFREAIAQGALPDLAERFAALEAALSA